jgi:hypothetical protein
LKQFGRASGKEPCGFDADGANGILEKRLCERYSLSFGERRQGPEGSDAYKRVAVSEAGLNGVKGRGGEV